MNSTQSPHSRPPLVAWGCAVLFALAFISAGVLPLLSLFHVFPRAGDMGDHPPLFPVVASALGFIAVGLYMMGNIVRSAIGLPRFSTRILADIIVVALALPFNWWLFFGKATGDSTTSITLPLGITLFTTAPLPFDFILAKLALGLICIILDLILVSEVLGLGWFTWTSGGGEG